MTEPLLEVRDLACTRDGRRLFDDLNFGVAGGQCLALMGPNGSGKSTLLRCIAGFYPDYTGEISVGPLEYLGHRPGVSLALSPLENLRWYQGLSGRAATLEELLERVGLAGYENVLSQHLSAGQQRRVALARLRLSSAPLWLLDEPFTALDDAGHTLVRGLLGEHLAAGGAVIAATHHPLEVPGSERLILGGPQVEPSL
jgi:heme exporter protein A